MLDDEIKLAVILCGLPGRGKTYIGNKVCRYLNWKGHPTKIFSTGAYRQKISDPIVNTSSFFDSQHTEGVELRRQVVNSCFEDYIKWLQRTTTGRVAIFDGSNITRSWRATMKKRIEDETSATVFFIESYCDDPGILKANMEELQHSMPDYKDTPQQEALDDFQRRVDLDSERYEPLDAKIDADLSFLKMINVNKTMITNQVEGYMKTGIVYFLMNIHIVPRSIYITRHGESEYNLEGKLGGDSGLSERGLEYSKKLHDYMCKCDPENLQVWTSTLKRARQTGQYFTKNKREWRCLEEIDAGICDGMTYQEVLEKYPDEFKARDENKYHYRYPRGESYHDIVVRLEPIMMELERAHNLLVIAHQAVLRCVLAYFYDKNCDELPYIKVPLHSVIKITPVAYGCRVETVDMEIEAVNTYRPPSQGRRKSVNQDDYDREDNIEYKVHHINHTHGTSLLDIDSDEEEQRNKVVILEKEK